MGPDEIGSQNSLLRAVAALAYSSDTNLGLITQASHALAQVLADSSPSVPPVFGRPPAV